MGLNTSSLGYALSYAFAAFEVCNLIYSTK